MQERDLSFVRAEMAAEEAPPVTEHGVIGWAKRNLFASVGDTVLTIIGLAIVAFALPPLFRWLFLDAQWAGTGRTFCATAAQGGIRPDGWSGACWAFVGQKIEQFIFGRYPVEERWRVILVAVLLVALLVPLLIPRVPWKGLNTALVFLVLPFVAFFLLLGGSYPAIEGHFVAILSATAVVAALLVALLAYFRIMPTGKASFYLATPVALFFFLVWLSSRLTYVETPLWGGLMVTLVLSFVGIAISLPAGILLALGRRSRLPVVRVVCVAFIELIRGVPLVTVLFMASVMLPLFLPAGMTFDKLLRALVGVALFASAYMAEVIRAGLQAVPKGQYEGADSLGLGYWQKMGLVILPQALKIVIPGIVSEFIGLFKDTSLVYIIGMFDLLGTVRQNFADAAWATPQTPMTGLVFAGFVYWCFCFSMSRYSQFMERRLDTGQRR